MTVRLVPESETPGVTVRLAPESEKQLAPGVTVRLVPGSEIPGVTTLDARVRNTRSDCMFGASQNNSWHQE